MVKRVKRGWGAVSFFSERVGVKGRSKQGQRGDPLLSFLTLFTIPLTRTLTPSYRTKKNEISSLPKKKTASYLYP